PRRCPYAALFRSYRGPLLRSAEQRGLDSSWVYAITRQESGFMDDARSGAGASGLMQVMPTTARETARRFGIALKSNRQLFDPDLNIQLEIGRASCRERVEGSAGDVELTQQD